MNPLRKEEICRIARQISTQSLQLKGIVDTICRRSSSSDNPYGSSSPSPTPAYGQQQFGLPTLPGPQTSLTQFYVPVVPIPFPQQQFSTPPPPRQDKRPPQARRTSTPRPPEVTEFTMESKVIIEESGSAEDEGTRFPTTTHISTRHVPQPPPPPAANEPEPEHPRPYEDDPIWSVWENNMVKLIQLLKMLLLELRNVSEYTLLDTDASANEANYANKFAAGRIIGGFQNRENVYQAVTNPEPFPQLYPPPKPPPPPPKAEESGASRIDLGAYFKKLAAQMDALTESLKPNPFPPHAGAPMQKRLVPLEENAGRLAHTLSGVSKAIAKPVEKIENILSRVDPALLRSQVPCGPTADSAPARNNVTFRLGTSQVDGSSTAECSPLIVNVNRLTQHMNEVSNLFKGAMGLNKTPPKPPPRMSIEEEEDLRYCVVRLTENMNRVARDLRKAMEENTVLSASRLVEDDDDD